MLHRRWALAVPALTVIVLASACCPVTAPPSTAFVARLTALADGAALAQLDDGRELVVSGLKAVPTGRVYVTGQLLPDGTVAAASVRPLSASKPATAQPPSSGAAAATPTQPWPAGSSKP